MSPDSPDESASAAPALEAVLHGQGRDVDGFTVARILPALTRKHLGPFCFFDHLGPSELGRGRGFDVRPHPHIGLSTVTYLLEGEIVHRDSLGSEQVIRPGAVNWMTSGGGIVHSERTPSELRQSGSRLHAIQLWVALPTEYEEMAPEFHHHPEHTLPEFSDNGVHFRVLAGTAYGKSSPVRIFSPLFYLEASCPAGRSLPLPEEHEERGVYVLSGELGFGSERIHERSLAIFRAGGTPVLRAESDSRVLLLGGAAPDGPRYIEWNFVSSSRERIERAKAEWRAGAFPKVPGDELEFIPLPEPRPVTHG
ncbi:MAG TPA: pirin family protein [Polyangiaceae bacterium]|jgi:redox-sensitive bicupin YhaK (pirin superfamily)|nr:pirin family protein [Polyangiaceae bacterium]